MWTTLQGRGDVEDRIGYTNTKIAALDGKNVQADQITQASRLNLEATSGTLTYKMR